jgi:hypothetical protein
MSRMSRWLRVMVLVVVTAMVWAQPDEASAWFGRCYRGFYGGGFYGYGFRPWCGPRFYGGWYGGTRVFYSNSMYLGGPWGGFYSGSIGPRWFAPYSCGPFWGGGFGWPCTSYPVAYPGWCGYGFGYSPIVLSPYGGSIAPVFGPAGVPSLGLAANASTPTQTMTAAPTAIAAAVPLPRAPASPAAGRSPVLARLAALRGATPATIAIRASNGDARLRAARLVAVGDRHLRAAVDNPAKLAAALDAYRRAATIAPDQADTYLRQAIALSALDRSDDAARALDRAVVIDARLGEDPTAAAAARGALPPDPVFGDRADAGPMTLTSRSRDLLGRIFSDGGRPARAAAGNWIANRWTREVGGPAAGQVEAIAAR